jgi:hypothetical protein
MTVTYEAKSSRTHGEGVAAVPLIARIARRDLTPDSAVDICEFSAVRQLCAQPLDQSSDLLRARLRCRLVAATPTAPSQQSGQHDSYRNAPPHTATRLQDSTFHSIL